MKKPINICVVGLGRAGNFHLSSIKNSDRFNLLYVVDTNKDIAEATAVKYNCIAHTDIEKVLMDNDLDAVVIASPTDSHFEYIKKALEAGKHVFTEKPVGHTVTEIRNCYRLSREHKKVLHLGFQRRVDKNFAALKSRLHETGSARIIKASSRDNPKPSYEYLKISGNIFHDMLIHDFDMLMFLLGPKIPQTVFASGHAYDPTIKSFSDYDTVLVSIQYPDGLVCSIDTSRTAPYGYDQRIEVFGENGMMTVDNERNNTLNFYNESGMSHQPFNYSFPERYKEAYIETLRQFSEGIHHSKQYNIEEAECVLAHQLADAAYESAKTGKAVDFAAFSKLG